MRMIDDKGHGCVQWGGDMTSLSLPENVPHLKEAILCLLSTRLHQMKYNFQFSGVAC